MMSRLETDLFDPPPDPDLLCAICQCVLSNPTEASACRHVFCHECIMTWLNSGARTCPTCRAVMTSYDMRRALPALCNVIGRLMMRCVNHAAGCTMRLAVEHLETHLRSECEWVVERCECGANVLRRDRDTHKNVCAYLLFPCSGCNLMITAQERSTHDCVRALHRTVSRQKYLLQEQSKYVHSASMPQQLQRELDSSDRRTRNFSTSLAATEFATHSQPGPSTMHGAPPGVEQDILTLDFPSANDGNNGQHQYARQPADNMPPTAAGSPSALYAGDRQPGATPPPYGAYDYFDSDAETDDSMPPIAEEDEDDDDIDDIAEYLSDDEHRRRAGDSDWDSNYDDEDGVRDRMYRSEADDEDDGYEQLSMSALDTSTDSESESLRDASRPARHGGSDNDDDDDSDDDLNQPQQDMAPSSDHQEADRDGGNADEQLPTVAVAIMDQNHLEHPVTGRLSSSYYSQRSDTTDDTTAAATAADGDAGRASAAGDNDAPVAAFDSNGVVSDGDDSDLSLASPPASPSGYGDDGDHNDDGDDGGGRRRCSSSSSDEAASDDERFSQQHNNSSASRSPQSPNPGSGGSPSPVSYRTPPASPSASDSSPPRSPSAYDNSQTASPSGNSQPASLSDHIPPASPTFVSDRSLPASPCPSESASSQSSGSRHEDSPHEADDADWDENWSPDSPTSSVDSDPDYDADVDRDATADDADDTLWSRDADRRHGVRRHRHFSTSSSNSDAADDEEADTASATADRPPRHQRKLRRFH